jgi:pyruvate/2-oxoglutarate dehydrogenase complex dihydrolipoamide acyltransferase (E2) component
MTSLVLQFNEAAVAAFEGNTRLRVLMKKRGGKEFLGLRPSYRVSGKNLQLKTVKGEDGQTTSELPANFIKELKFDRPELGAAFHLKNIGYGWFILDGMPADATTDLPTVVIADSALIKQAAKAAAVEEKKTETPTPTENADANADATTPAVAADTPAPLTEEQKAGAKSAAEELAAHFGLKSDDDATVDGNAGAATEGTAATAATDAPQASAEAEATPAPAAKKTAAKKGSVAAKKSPIAKTTASAAKKKPAKKTATA